LFICLLLQLCKGGDFRHLFVVNTPGTRAEHEAYANVTYV